MTYLIGRHTQLAVDTSVACGRLGGKDHRETATSLSSEMMVPLTIWRAQSHVPSTSWYAQRQISPGMMLLMTPQTLTGMLGISDRHDKLSQVHVWRTAEVPCVSLLQPRRQVSNNI